MSGDSRAVLAGLCRKVVSEFGGRYSAELGIDVDRGEAEVERWFLAATLFGARISARVAEHAFAVLAEAGLARIEQARHMPSAELIGLLDSGGYARYDFRTATRLRELSQIVCEQYGGAVAAIGGRYPGYPELAAALDALPGWGAVTIELFLRELRGVWPGARPPLGKRAAAAGRHLGLLEPAEPRPLGHLAELAADSGLDARDLESALVRLSLAHRDGMKSCPGGSACALLNRD